MKSKQPVLGDLALRFVLGTLSDEEKHMAQELIMNNPAFLEALKLELALAKNAALLKQPISDSRKKRVYSNITVSTSVALCKGVFQTVLEFTMPQVTWPVLQLFERSVFANE